MLLAQTATLAALSRELLLLAAAAPFRMTRLGDDA
jgi:hypothetical protein